MKKRQSVFLLSLFLLCLLMLGGLIYEFSHFCSTQINFNTQKSMEEKILMSKKNLENHIENLIIELHKKASKAKDYYKNLSFSSPTKSHTGSPFKPELKSSFHPTSPLSLNSDSPFLLLFEIEMKEKKDSEIDFKPHWGFSSLSTKEKTKEEWNLWFKQEFSNIPLKKIYSSNANQILFFKIHDFSSYPSVALFSKFNRQEKFKMAREENHKTSILMGVLPLSHFSFLNQMYKDKGTEELFFLINQNGFALSYPERSYIGSSLKNHPLGKRVLSQKKTRFLEEFKHKNGKRSFLAAAQLKDSNLYFAIENSSFSFFESLLPFLTERLSIKGLAFLFLCLLISLWFIRPPLNHLSYLRKSILDVISDQKLKPPPFDEAREISKSLKVLEQLTRKIKSFEKQLEEKTKKITQESDLKAKEWLNHEITYFTNKLKPSLLSLMAQNQIMKSKCYAKSLNTEDMKTHLQSMEEELDSIRFWLKQKEEDQKHFSKEMRKISETLLPTSLKEKRQEDHKIKESLDSFYEQKIDFTLNKNPINFQNENLNLREKTKEKQKKLEGGEKTEKEEFQLSRLKTKNDPFKPPKQKFFSS